MIAEVRPTWFVVESQTSSRAFKLTNNIRCIKFTNKPKLHGGKIAVLNDLQQLSLDEITLQLEAESALMADTGEAI